jgi:hypothetical protein
MTGPPDGGYAELWLAEMGAWVPEWHDGGALAPRVRGYGLGLEPAERARRHGAQLEHEGRVARAHRALAAGP